jgi:hypothetical protein
MHPSSANDEFMGMMDYIMESFHDLLARDSEAISNSDSSGGSHHPSRERFMVGIPEGHVESVHDGGLLPRLTAMTRSREVQESHVTCWWSS